MKGGLRLNFNFSITENCFSIIFAISETFKDLEGENMRKYNVINLHVKAFLAIPFFPQKLFFFFARSDCLFFLC